MGCIKMKNNVGSMCSQLEQKLFLMISDFVNADGWHFWCLCRSMLPNYGARLVIEMTFYAWRRPTLADFCCKSGDSPT